MTSFDDPAAVAAYAANPPRLVPGFSDLYRMARLLLAEAAPADARILAVGAGGGLELAAFSRAEPGWRFVGVDPSSPMLDLAARTLGPLRSRAELHHGYVFDAPEGPFDGACCLLTLHFLSRADRLETLKAVRRRLRPGGRFVMAHHSLPEGKARERWLDRFAAFAADNGAALDQARARALGLQLPILPPEAEVELLREAGFSDPELFYAAFSFRGWVARA